jgi:hypothetical protein
MKAKPIILNEDEIASAAVSRAAKQLPRANSASQETWAHGDAVEQTLLQSDTAFPRGFQEHKMTHSPRRRRRVCRPLSPLPSTIALQHSAIYAWLSFVDNCC